MNTTTHPAALVTGATSGIGATYSEKLAARGHGLVLVARDPERLAAKAAGLRARYGVEVDVLQADLTEPAAVAVVSERIKCDETVGILINNAGVGPKGSLLEDDLPTLDRMLKLNVVAAHALAVTAAMAFRERNRGTIVNIASVVALLPERFHGTYSATKAFVLNLTQALHAELQGTEVRVQAVLPGLTRTEIFERAGSDASRLDPSMVMSVDDMVSAALSGLDSGELVTIPSLEEPELWNAIDAARAAIAAFLSLSTPARRYSPVHDRF